MTKCWIKTDYVPEDCSFLTKGKWYFDLNGGGYIEDDSGDVIPVNYRCSPWLDGGDWQVYYGDTPPDCGIQSTTPECSTSNDKALGDGGAVGTSIGLLKSIQKEIEENVLWSGDMGNTVVSADKVYLIVSKYIDKLKSGEYSVIHNTNIN